MAPVVLPRSTHPSTPAQGGSNLTMEKKSLKCHYWALVASPEAEQGQIPVKVGINGSSGYGSNWAQVLGQHRVN